MSLILRIKWLTLLLCLTLAAYCLVTWVGVWTVVMWLLSSFGGA